MLDPMADPSINISNSNNQTIFFPLELAQEVDDKTADIKKLAYDISTKLKSILINLRFKLI
jgi:hypothetical protein